MAISSEFYLVKDTDDDISVSIWKSENFYDDIQVSLFAYRDGIYSHILKNLKISKK
jgi:hypothetical protein